MILIAVALLAATAAAGNGNNVTLTSEILVERKAASDGIKLEPAQRVDVGDKLVFRLHYRNAGTVPADKFVLSQPIPPAIEFIATDDRPVDYSVDKGRTWGPLETLKVHPYIDEGVQDFQAWEKARATDVTNLRWTFAKPIAPGASGTVSFRAKVR